MRKSVMTTKISTSNQLGDVALCQSETKNKKFNKIHFCFSRSLSSMKCQFCQVSRASVIMSIYGLHMSKINVSVCIFIWKSACHKESYTECIFSNKFWDRVFVYGGSIYLTHQTSFFSIKIHSTPLWICAV